MKIFRLVSLFFLLSCNPFKHPKRDKQDTIAEGFYTDAGDWDDSRIPLLKPYELLKLKGQKGWEMALQTPMISVAVHNVQGINIIDSLIVVHSGETNLRGGVKVKEAWFVVSLKTQSEKGFAKKQDFENELANEHFNTVIFFEPDKIYSDFLKKRRIEWGALSN